MDQLASLLKGPPGNLLIDSNLLLLLFVGKVNRARVEKFSRTSRFRAEDYDLLLGIVKRAKSMLTTPHILTEVCNLGGKLLDPEKSRFYLGLAEATNSYVEEYDSSAAVTKDKDFIRFGLTDSAILYNTSADRCVLTADVALHIELLKRGVRSVNFEHLRFLSL